MSQPIPVPSGSVSCDIVILIPSCKREGQRWGREEEEEVENIVYGKKWRERVRDRGREERRGGERRGEEGRGGERRGEEGRGGEREGKREGKEGDKGRKRKQMS